MTTKITIAHFRALKYCSKGSRRFFKKHGLDWNSFLTDGLSIGEATKINSSLLNRAVQLALKEESSG